MDKERRDYLRGFATSRNVVSMSPDTVVELLDALAAATERAERAERGRDEAIEDRKAARDDAARAAAMLAVRTMERDEARAERDARPSITAEDAAAKWDDSDRRPAHTIRPPRPRPKGGDAVTDIVDEARALLAKATPGEWCVEDPDGDREWYDADPHRPGAVVGRARARFGRAWEVVIPCDESPSGKLYSGVPSFNEHDAKLIAAAPRLLGTLAAECERLRAENDKLKGLGFADMMTGEREFCPTCETWYAGLDPQTGMGSERCPLCEAKRLQAELAEAKHERDTEADAVTGQRETIKSLRAKLAAVTAERDAAWLTTAQANDDADGYKGALLSWRARAEAAESALAAAREAMPTGWRSMESAPRDGTKVFVSHRTATRCWVEERESQYIHDDRLSVAWMPLPPPFTGDPATLDDRAAQRSSFAAGNVSIDRDPDARRTVAVEDEP